MPVGYQSTQQGLNQQAGQIISMLVKAMQNVQQYNAYVQFLGLAGLMAAPLSFAQADAEAILEVFAELDAVRAVLEGDDYTGPGLPHNFVEDTIPFWGGNITA
jgi:hypothetical protein